METKIDIGCGYSNLLKTDFLKLDINLKCKPHIVADVQWLPLSDSSIDEIYCSHVLEHLQNPKQCLREVWRVLKNGGKATFLVPNMHLPWTIHVMWKYGNRQTPYEHHKWRTNKTVLEKILVAQGFIVSKVLSIKDKERHWEIEYVFYATPFHMLFFSPIYLMRKKIRWFNLLIEMINKCCYINPDKAPETKVRVIKIVNAS